MKKIKYFSVLMLVAILTLTGCTSPFEKKLSAEDRLEKALNKLQDAENFTMKMNVDAKGEVEGETVKVKGDLTAKVDLKKEIAYIDVDFSAKAADEDVDLEIEAYSVVDDDEATIYLGYDGDWVKFTTDLDDAGLSIDTDDKVDMKNFKKIKEVETKKGITKIEATIDTGDVIEDADYGKMTVYFYIDKKNNITKIEFDTKDLLDELGVEFDKFDMSITLEDIGSTKVKVPSDVEDDAEEIDLEDLLGSLLGSGFDYTSGDDRYFDDWDYDYDDDDDNDTSSYDDDYSAADIMYDILLSGSIKSGVVEVDFKNYNGELLLYDDEYDVKRVTQGKVRFTDGEFEILTPFVIDGKTCHVGDTRLDIEC